MNSNIKKLSLISNKSDRRIIGLMSGTSLDGLDVALCSFKGHGVETQVNLLKFETVPYLDQFKIEVRKVFAKETIEFRQLCALNPWIGVQHGEMVLKCLKKWNIDASTIDIIASHGQTVYHAPKFQHNMPNFSNSTLQIGDGDHVAVTTSIITISDFRQKHIAAGGEGAPLALYGDYLLFSETEEIRILLNIGGIANFTYLPGKNSQKAFATDCGPGNTLLDFFAGKLFSMDFDQDSKISKSGTVNQALLSALKNHKFFTTGFPKTTGPEVFSPNFVAKCQKDAKAEGIKPEDLMRTLTQFSAETISEAISKCLTDDDTLHKHPRIYTSGGGNHNPLLMELLTGLLPEITLEKIEKLEIRGDNNEGIPGDAKEAVLFAILANEALCGEPLDFGPNVPSVTMGKISFP